MKTCLGIALLLLAAATARADGMRCGTKLASEGDTRSAVIAKCGEPAEIERRTVLRRPLIWIHGRPFHVGDGLVEVPVELWIYNLGPNKFMRRLRFEDGLLVEIESLGYGYRN